MPKTLINLDAEDKAWLDHEARRCKLPMTELVRQAVHAFGLREQSRERYRFYRDRGYKLNTHQV